MTHRGRIRRPSGPLVDAEIARRVTLAWHGVNDRHNLRQFIGSDVRWAELDVRRDHSGRLVLRHDSFVQTPVRDDEELSPLRDVLEVLRWSGRSVKLDLKEGGDVVRQVLDDVRAIGFADDELWFNGTIEALGREGFSRLRRTRPGTVRQCPIDFLVPLLLAAPEFAREALTMLSAWGVTRASLDWRTPGGRDVLGVVEGLGWQVNLYGVPDLESFLEAAALLPTSLTADFNFPEWNLFGRGPRRGVAVASDA